MGRVFVVGVGMTKVNKKYLFDDIVVIGNGFFSSTNLEPLEITLN